MQVAVRPNEGLGRNRGPVPTEKPCHQGCCDGEDDCVADDSNVAQLHVGQRYSCQANEGQRSADIQQNASYSCLVRALNGWCREQCGQGEEDVPRQDVQCIGDRGPLEGEHIPRPVLPGEAGLTAEGQDAEVHTAGNYRAPGHESDRYNRERPLSRRSMGEKAYCEHDHSGSDGNDEEFHEGEPWVLDLVLWGWQQEKAVSDRPNGAISGSA